jgi:Protein of unknown function (DUF2628)
MAIFTVHLPPIADERRRLHDAEFVRDGFSRSAFVFGGFWLVSKRLWLSALIFAVLIVGVWAASAFLNLPLRVPFGISLLLSILLGLEGSSLQRWRFRRRGWSEAGLVSARDLEEAELRFFDQQGIASTKPTAKSEARPVAAQEGGVIGLFPEPGARG